MCACPYPVNVAESREVALQGVSRIPHPWNTSVVNGAVRHWPVRYRAHNGLPRPAVVIVPSEYGPGRPTPRLPLVISPHGRGVQAATNARLWRDLPAHGFVVICPGGMGRRLPLHSWGWRGQIADLARMPSIANATLPWLRVDPNKVYAVGGSMGGHETLLLLGQHPGSSPAPSRSTR